MEGWREEPKTRGTIEMTGSGLSEGNKKVPVVQSCSGTADGGEGEGPCRGPSHFLLLLLLFLLLLYMGNTRKPEKVEYFHPPIRFPLSSLR